MIDLHAPPGSAAIIAELARRVGAEIAPGAAWALEVRVGDLVADVTVSMRPVVSGEGRAVLLQRALEELVRYPGRVRRCEMTVNRGGGKFSKRPERDCKDDVAAVVIMGSGAQHFVCRRHRYGHGLDLSSVMAVLDLPEDQLVALRAAAERRELALAAAWAADEAAAHAKAVPAFSDPVGMDGWTYTPERHRWHREIEADGRIFTMAVELEASDAVGWEVLEGREGERHRPTTAWNVVDDRASAVRACRDVIGDFDLPKDWRDTHSAVRGDR